MVLSDRMPALLRNFFRDFIDLYMYVPSAPINVKCLLGHLRPRATPLFPNWKLAVSWFNVRHDTVTTPVTFFFSSIRTVGSADKLAPAGPSSSSTKGRQLVTLLFPLIASFRSKVWKETTKLIKLVVMILKQNIQAVYSRIGYINQSVWV